MLNQLPIGSVVEVKDFDEKLMIVAQYPITTIKDKEGYFDFCAVLLPIGLSDQKMHFFNKEDIKNIVFMGFIDMKFQSFINLAAEYEEKISLPKFTKIDFKEEYDEEQ